MMDGGGMMGGGGMTGLLLQIGATKLAVSIVLACAVWMVHRRVRSPAVSYPLWLLVLVTLLIPAVVALPVLPAKLVATATVPAAGTLDVVFAEVAADPEAGPRFGAFLQPGLAILWLVGTLALLVWTAVRTIRFRRTLTRALRPAPAWLQRQAAEIGRDLGLSRMPELNIADARVTPMVWWSGGKVRVLIPAFLLTGTSREELRAMLAHELAHVRRRDHLVRWLEWLACAVFWWNPVAWWARRQLQIAEEACCDRLAVDAGRSCPKTYANALLRVVASTSIPPGVRPLLPASAAGGVGRTQALERRIRMIVSTRTRAPAPRWLRATGRVALLCALPLGLIYCDWATAPMAADDEAGVDPVEAAAVVGTDELHVGANEALVGANEALVRAYQLLVRSEELHFGADELRAATYATARVERALSQLEAALQEFIREGMESGDLTEERGRELSAYLSGAASGRLIRYSLDNDIPDEISRKYGELLVTEMVERNRGLYAGDYTSRISTTDLQSPELEATLAELRELMQEIVQDPAAQARLGDWNSRYGELTGRVKELRTRLREAIRVPEGRE